jgi:hypothetical protein
MVEGKEARVAREDEGRDNQGHSVPWLPMSLEYVGRVDEVLRSGGGKLTVPAADPGEPRKETPH